MSGRSDRLSSPLDAAAAELGHLSIAVASFSVGEVDVRPFQPADAVRAAVEGWVDGSNASADDRDDAVYVVDDSGVVCGFVSVTRATHWTGDTDAYIGELVVAPDATD